jgi:transcriptional regulator with XRE-family HTH domain
MAYQEKFLKPEAHAMGVVGKRVRKVMDKTGYSRLEIAAISNVYPYQVSSALKGEGSLSSLIKIMHYLGFEIQFTKKRKTKKIEKNVSATKRLIKYKKLANEQTRKCRGLGPLTQKQLRELEQQKRTESGNFLGTGTEE